MKRTVLLILLSVQMAFFAQQISVGETVEIKTQKGSDFYFPKFNLDNSKVFFTNSSFKGLYSVDLTTGNTETITEDLGAGYEFTFSDNNHVFYRINKYDESGIKRTQSLIEKNLTTNEAIILASGRDLSVPQITTTGQIAYSLDGKVENLNSSSLSKTSTTAAIPTVFVDNTKIVLWNNGTKKTLDPVTEGNYIWVSLSPDKTRLLFTAAGNCTYISDLNGNILFKLGYANAPKWSPDGKWILYMVDKDNGLKVTSSDIFIVSSDGNTKYQVTNTEAVFEMYPEWSSDMSSIVYNSYDGKIFMTKLNIEE